MFRFTIRDLLWLMAFVGLGMAWLSHDLSWRENSRRQSDDNIRLAKKLYALQMENHYIRENHPQTVKDEMYLRMQRSLHDSIHNRP
jgi:hypothetical protein